MRVGVAHSAGAYTYPNGSGTQLMDGVNAIFNAGFPTLKIYLTSAYLTDYPLQSSWSAVPTTLTTLAQTTQMAAALAKGFQTTVITAFTFANGVTNWWQPSPQSAKYASEYTEIYNLAVHLLTTYNGSGRRFVIQQWEGDWAFMDSTTVDTYVDRKMVERYIAFLGTRQRAVSDARAATASDCQVLNAIEVNRVVDAKLYPHRRRIVRDIANLVKPDVVSYSAYDSTIVDQGGWGADLAAWTTATTPALTKALRVIKATWPGVPIQVGEFGFPEGAELPIGRDVGDMIQVVHDICISEGGVVDFIYWQVFDNTGRGFYTVKSDGTSSVAGTKLIALI